MLVVKKTTVNEVETNVNFISVAKEYGQESAIIGLPPPVEKIAAYRVIESSGILQCYGAFYEHLLVGLIAVLTPVIPHYGVSVSVAESFFVAKEYRRTGAGLKLLRSAQDHALSLGSPGIFVSAPVNSVLLTILPRMGYRETNRAFFKSFKLVENG